MFLRGHAIAFAFIMVVGWAARAAGQKPDAGIPADLRPYVKDYVTPEFTLRAGFVPYKPKVVWGEPLEITFRVENLGPKEFSFHFGGDNRGIGRHDRFKIQVTDAAGKTLADPHANAPNFGGLLTHEVLAPGGKIFEDRIDLTQFRTFEKPGEYEVTCSFAFDEPFVAKQGPDLPVVTSHFHLTIAERTPERVVAIVEEMAAKAQAAPIQELPGMLERIAVFGKEDAAPQLLRLAGMGSVERRAAVIGVLPRVSSATVLDAAIAALKDESPVIRQAAARALGAMGKPRAVEALLQALRIEKGETGDAVLIALGASKAERALPVIVEALDHGVTTRRLAAIMALTAYGEAEAVKALGTHVADPDLPFRFQVVQALVEQLHQPLNREWLYPILMRRTQSQEWMGALRLVRMYGGDQAIPTLCSCLDFEVAWSGRNAWILGHLQVCANPPVTDYVHDWNREGTPEELERNRRTLAALKKLAAPIPEMARHRLSLPHAEFKTAPPIDFTPVLTPHPDSAEIRSGFLLLNIRRNGYQVAYTPSEAYRGLYATAGSLRGLLQQPNRIAALGITEEQAKRLRALPLPPGDPDLNGATLLYLIYKESPAGPAQEESAEDLGTHVKEASQRYHAAVATFVEAAGKILTPGQWDKL